MYKILIVLCGLLATSLATDTECSELETLNDHELWNLLRPKEFDLLFVLTAGSLSILLLLLTLGTWRIYPSFTIPSDIMFAICLSELIQNTSMVASAAYFKAHPSSTEPPDFESACVTMGIFYTIGNTSSLIYNLIFCVVLSFSLKKTLKGSLFNQVRYHALAIVFIISAAVALGVTETLGTGFNGICGYKISNRQSIGRFILELLICGICLVCMVQFRGKIPKNDYFKKVAMFGYFYYYMGIFSFVQIFTTISFMVGNIACRTGSDYSSSIIVFSVLCSTIFSIALSYVLAFLRFAHPMVRLKIAKLFGRAKQQEDLDPNEEPWLGNLLQSIKGSQIISLMAGILVSFGQNQKKVPNISLNSSHFNHNYIVRVNQHIADQYFLKRINPRQSVLIKQKLEGLRALDYQVTLYGVGMFGKLLAEEKDANVFRSLDISKNLPLIKKRSYLNGGKSGEFFYSTYDHQFIFKTIKQEQAEVYLQKLEDFYKYFESNPDSLIAKILGLFKFCRKDVKEQPIYIILMRNVSPYDRSTYERIYDIKGSEFNRSTMDEQKISSPEKLRHITLKDLDFKKLEGKVSIKNEQSNRIKILLRKDAEFLGRMGVMDYSVLIIKRSFDKKEDHGRQVRKNEAQSTKNQNQFFNIGIIDYLESWTLKRKAERAFKSMITSKKVTAASPDEYSHRLSHFLDEIM